MIRLEIICSLAILLIQGLIVGLNLIRNYMLQDS